MFKKLFGKKKSKQTIIKDKNSTATIDENGNLTLDIEFSGSFNGKVLNHKFQLNTTIEEFMENGRIAEENKNNPDSCEREPNDNEIKLHKEYFYKNCVLGTIGCDNKELHDRLRPIYYATISSGYNNVVVSKSDYQECLRIIEVEKQKKELLNKTAELNNKGIQLEKNGDIDSAIKVYEENIKLGYPATHSYNRLMILYRKEKDIENEIRVINLAIDVFSKESKARATKAIEKHPHKQEEILNALAKGERIMGEDGFYIFIPYDEVNKYKNRLLKLRKL